MTGKLESFAAASSPEVPINRNNAAVGAASVLGPRLSAMSGLDYAYYGGPWNGAVIADGTVTLTANSTNYIECTTAGVVSKNVVGFTTGYMPIAIVGTNATAIDLTTFIDRRVFLQPPASIALQNIANHSFSVVDKGNSGTSLQTFDYSSGSHQIVTSTGNHSFAFSNFPSSGQAGYMMIEYINAGAFTLTAPTINWIKKDGSVTTTFADYLTDQSRTLQASGTDFFVFWTRDAGTTIWGAIV